MSQTVTVRLTDAQVAAMGAAAAAAGVPPATWAASAIVDALGAAMGGPPADGPLVQAVRHELVGDDAPLVGAVLIQLARQAERGGSAATMQLLGEVRRQLAETREAMRQADAAADASMPRPMWTHCQACRRVMTEEEIGGRFAG